IACNIIKKEEKEIIGKRLLEVIPGHRDIIKEYDKSLFEIYSEVVETGKSKSLLFKFDSGGITGWFSNKSIKLNDGFVVTFSVVTELVTKTKELEEINKNLEKKVIEAVKAERLKEEALIQQSKLAAMGDMLSAIAHQWRQPLAAIGYGIVVIDDVFSNIKNIEKEDKEAFQDAYSKIEDQIQYLTVTIEDFRKFYSPSKILENFNVRDIILSSLHFFEHITKNNRILTKVYCDTELEIYGNSNQLRQAFLNIIDNSIFAFNKNENDKKFISISVNKIDSDNIEISFTDNAGGIEKEIQPKIFEPYFTTKGPTSGTGMGLYISKLIIENSFKGTIEAFNEDEGAKFILRIQSGRE
ncbi:MAG: HAMP domain-containing histidine kinase, partial [Leptospiraceae bacterium]|nr:HAMP domain-containing histidine kinase [Leptospiraceae bacterium]